MPKTLNIERVPKGQRYYFITLDFDSNLIVSNDIEPYTTADQYADAGNYFPDWDKAQDVADKLNELRRKLTGDLPKNVKKIKTTDPNRDRTPQGSRRTEAMCPGYLTAFSGEAGAAE